MTTSVLTKFLQTHGITIVCCGEKGSMNFGFDGAVKEPDRERFKKIFTTMAALLELMPSEEELKITLRTESLLLRKNAELYVGVVAVKGHPIVKSIQRMVRQAFRKLGAPLPMQRRPPTTPPVVPAAPVVPVAPESTAVPEESSTAGVPESISSAPTAPLDVTRLPPDEDGGGEAPPAS